MDTIGARPRCRDFRTALAETSEAFLSIIGPRESFEREGLVGLSTPSEPLARTLLFSLAPDETLFRLLATTKPCAIIVPLGSGAPIAALGHLALEAAAPKYAFARLARALIPLAAERGRIQGSRSPLACIAEGAIIGEDVTIEEFVSVAADAVIGAGSYLMRGSCVGPRVRLGRGCVLKENSVVGDQGFGFGLVKDMPHLRLPQLGGVELGDEVELGACSTVGSGTLGSTRIGAGAKINNHVHIAHNCDIGAGSIIACGASVSGSTIIGERCWIAPGAVIRNKLVIGAGATVGMGAVVVKDVPAGATVTGVPARVIEREGPWYESESGTP